MYRSISAPRTMGTGTTVAVITGTVGSFLIDYLPNTFFVGKFKNIVKMYKFGEEVPVHDDVKKLYNQVLDDLKITEDVERQQYHPFTVAGFNLFHAGVNTGPHGAIIGIPQTYYCKNTFSINISDIRIGTDKKEINIYHPATEPLLSSLVLSDKAKKYGIAREILMCNKNLPVYRSIESSVMVMATFLATEFARRKFNLRNKPFSVKLFTYATIGLVGFSVWFQIRDGMNIYAQKYVDKEIAKLGPDYIEGGKEFYSKMLQKNIALRDLLEARGSKTFNRDGEEITFIRRRNMSLRLREKFFNDLLNNVNNETA